MIMIFILIDELRLFIKNVWRKRRLFEIVIVEYENRDDLENVEVLLGRIDI